MDLRIEKTRKSIINAFIELRSKKPLEKITVKELSEVAVINKATFYLHYKDIYDLSDSLETELINNVLKNIFHPEALLTDPALFIEELLVSFNSQFALLKIIFQGNRISNLPQKIERGVRKLIFEKYPEYESDFEKNVMLTYIIQGAYYSFIQYAEHDTNMLISAICNISKKLS